MRRLARSEHRKIVRKLREPGGRALAAAEIGSRVFPLRAPPAPMPSVATRRSTRVFVPKTAAAAAKTPGGRGGGDRDSAPAARVLRSGKRLELSKTPVKGDEGRDEWLRVLGGAGGDAANPRWWKEEGDELRQLAVPESDAGSAEKAQEYVDLDAAAGFFKKKRFRLVYSRKRRRRSSDGAVSSSVLSSDSDNKDDRKYGIVFRRKERRKRPKVAPLVEGILPQTGFIDEPDKDSRRAGGSERRISIPDTAREFASKMGISEGDLWIGVGGPVVLAVLIEASCTGSSQQFSNLLISILRWMRRARVRFLDFVAFLLSESIAGVFSLHGVHLLPMWSRKNNAMLQNARFACGQCKIFGARQFVPLLSLNFSAIPFYFKSLHVTIVFGSQFLPAVLSRYLMGLDTSPSVDAGFEENDSHVPAETGLLGTGVSVSVIPAMKRNESQHTAEATESVAQNAVIVHGLKLRNHQKKRSSLRHSRSRRHSAMGLRTGTFHTSRNNFRVSSEAKACSLRDRIVEPARVKALDISVGDFGRDDSDVSSPLGSNEKHKSNKKSPVDRIKELKMAMAEVKQNIDSVRCNVNILVTVSDRCWREEGAVVMLEFLDSKEWCLAVKAQGSTRYLHKPQDMRSCVVNRYTHAYMWAGEDGWKLEFCDKWDWLVFKELHLECRERNMQDVAVKIIPVPGVHEVPGYEENAVAPFVRPHMYIRMTGDEVGRALTSQVALYDMDCEDEKWLIQLNSCSSDVKNRGTNHISEEDFEKIIFALERDAYKNPDEIADKERALILCQDLGKEDMLAAVYDYWIKKRTKKRAALVTVFQGPPLRRPQVTQKLSFLRKKRSFKRQKSQGGRGKPDFFFPDGGKEVALRRVQEAESAADRAVESAIHLRSRAQMLMANAELATYKSVMALRIAEAIRVSGSPDLASSILD